MEEMKSEAKVTKTKVFNVIILDRSGSMATIRSAAIGGLNETLVSIQKAQEKFSDTQEHFVSLVMFCSCETKLFLISCRFEKRILLNGMIMSRVAVHRYLMPWGLRLRLCVSI